MPYMNLPPGNRSVRVEGAPKPYVADRAGGRVFVEDHHVGAINCIGGNGDAGLLDARFRVFGGSRKAGRWCKSCQPARLWNAWNDVCPRCGAATEPE